MRILYFTSSVEDYLGDSILHGLRLLYGKDCIDYPKCEILYKNCPEHMREQVRGNGFTLYSGLLEDIHIDRFNIETKIHNQYYDLIIISDIQRQYGWFLHFRPWLTAENTIILDGQDTHQPYPARGHWWRKPYYWFLPKAHKDFLYFKREWTPDTHFSIWMRMLPTKLRNKLPKPINLRSTAFSFPKEKIVTMLPKKIKDFATHIVDPEIAARIAGSFETYAFETEKEYYKDLQDSRFGITTIRAGWDCLRHYEIAANGAVICFKDLEEKPHTCAPHGLKDGYNCLSYKNYDHLISKIKHLKSGEYEKIQLRSWRWAFENNSKNRAAQIIKEHQSTIQILKSNLKLALS
jgi:hypothetical protein